MPVPPQGRSHQGNATLRDLSERRAPQPCDPQCSARGTRTATAPHGHPREGQPVDACSEMLKEAQHCIHSTDSVTPASRQMRCHISATTSQGAPEQAGCRQSWARGTDGQGPWWARGSSGDEVDTLKSDCEEHSEHLWATPCRRARASPPQAVVTGGTGKRNPYISRKCTAAPAPRTTPCPHTAMAGPADRTGCGDTQTAQCGTQTGCHRRQAPERPSPQQGQIDPEHTLHNLCSGSPQHLL